MRAAPLSSFYGCLILVDAVYSAVTEHFKPQPADLFFFFNGAMRRRRPPFFLVQHLRVSEKPDKRDGAGRASGCFTFPSGYFAPLFLWAERQRRLGN